MPPFLPNPAIAAERDGWRRLAGLVLALLALAAFAKPLRVRAFEGQEVIDRMLAVVAGDLIMLSDVTAAVEFGLVPRTSGPDVTSVVLRQLIDRSLMLAEVDRYAPPEPGESAVDRELGIVRERFPSPASFESALTRYGLEESNLRETLRANLRLRAYLEQRFSIIVPSDEEIAAYYRQHPEVFTRDGSLSPLDEVREEVVQALAFERRQAMIDDWIAGLRRRAAITDVLGTSPRDVPATGGKC